MGFWDRVKTLFWNGGTWNDYLQRVTQDFLSGRDSDVAAEYTMGSDAAMRFGAVFACCRVLAETMASLPVHEYRRNLSDDTREKTDETGILDIFKNAANDEMSAFAFTEMGMNQINLGGNLVCERLKNRFGDTVQLYPYAWGRVEIERDPDTKRLIYIIDGDRSRPRTRKDVFHIAGPSLDGIIGMSPIEYASKAVTLGLTYQNFGVNYFKNGAMPSMVFEHPSFLKDEALKRLKETIKKEYSGLKNAGTPMVLEDNMKVKELAVKMVDAQFLESRKYQTEEICRIFRVPPHMIQNLDRSTNNNIEHQGLEFVMFTMLPIVKRWEKSILHQMYTPEQRKRGLYIEYNMSGLMRGDMKSMYEAFAIGRQWGFLSVNDIRRLLNMNPVPNGDIYLQPMNMIEAGMEPEKIDPAIKDEINRLIEHATAVKQLATR